MEVQIRKRQSINGIRYQAVLEVWSDGDRKTITVGTYPTEALAQRAGIRESFKYENDFDRSIALGGRITVSDWVESWIASRKGKVKDSTQKEYARKLRNHIVPFLGNIKMCDLSALQIKKWIDYMSTQNVSRNMQGQCLRVLKTCLTGAVSDGVLAKNPAQNSKLERTKALELEEQEAKPVKVWSHEEAQKLLTLSEGHKHLDAFITLGILAGLRPGEIGGLKWEDIDFLNSTVTVRRANRKSTSPKSGKSRVVPLPFEAVRRLMGYQNLAQNFVPSNPQAMLPEGVSTLTQGNLVPNLELGPWVLPVHHNRAAEYLKPFCQSLGITALPPHSLRHTFASLLLSAGIPVAAVSEYLGHSSPAVTLNVYSHAMPRDMQRATSVLESVLGVAPSPVTVWCPDKAPH